MSSDPIVGIDLGTSNSVVAYADVGGQARVLADEAGYKIHPSVVSFHPNGGVVVGAAAKQRKVIDPKNTIFSVKRLIGRSYDSPEVQTAKQRSPFQIKPHPNGGPAIVTRAGDYAVPEISAIVLDHVRNVANAALATPVERAVITVPASFNDAQRSATATAGSIAGLTVVRVLNEPTAAALAYGHTRDLREVIAVYDFGGGTFDITLLRLHDQVYEVLGTAGDSFLGGDDLDERLVDKMVTNFLATHRMDLRANEVAMMRLRAVAEQTKIELSRRSRAVVRIDEIAYGPSGKSLDLQIEIKRDDFVSLVADLIDRTFPVCREAIALAQLTPAEISDVILVGGTTKIPYVRDQAAKFFGKAPRTDVNPEEAVAVGASLQATSLQRMLGRKPSRQPTVAGADNELGETTATETTAAGPLLEETTVERSAPTMVPISAEDAPVHNSPVRVPKRPTAAYGVARLQMDARAGERQVERGQHHDVIDSRVTASVVAPTTTAALPVGRMTRPAASPPPMPSKAPTLQSPPLIPPRAVAVPIAPTSKPPSGLPQEVTTLVIEQRPLDLDPSRELDFGQADIAPHVTSRGIVPPSASAAITTPSLLQQVQQAVPMSRPPVVLDVTPRGLGIGTVAGFCEELIRRNSRLPAETRKLFTTSRDRQDVVRIIVCQGESRRLDDNVVIGDLMLEALPPRARGETSIEVTFHLDASGILQVRARDAQTGKEQRASLDLVGGVPDSELAASRERLQALRR